MFGAIVVGAVIAVSFGFSVAGIALDNLGDKIVSRMDGE